MFKDAIFAWLVQPACDGLPKGRYFNIDGLEQKAAASKISDAEGQLLHARQLSPYRPAQLLGSSRPRAQRIRGLASTR